KVLRVQPPLELFSLEEKAAPLPGGLFVCVKSLSARSRSRDGKKSSARKSFSIQLPQPATAIGSLLSYDVCRRTILLQMRCIVLSARNPMWAIRTNNHRGTLSPPLLVPDPFVSGSSEPNHPSRESNSLNPYHAFHAFHIGEAAKEDRDLQGAARSLATDSAAPRPARAGPGIDGRQPRLRARASGFHQVPGGRHHRKAALQAALTAGGRGPAGDAHPGPDVVCADPDAV